MIFTTTVNGVPCQCKVLHHAAAISATRIHASAPEEFEFEILDRRGRRATWLDRYLAPHVKHRLLEEYRIMLKGELLELAHA